MAPTASTAEVTAVKKRIRKPKTPAKAAVDGASDQPLGRMRVLTESVSKQIEEMQMDMTKLYLRARFHGSAEGREALQLAEEVMQRASVLLDTAKKVKEAVESEEGAVEGVAEGEAAAVEEFPAEEEMEKEEPYVPLEFTIPQEVIERKLALQDDDAKKFWSHMDYKGEDGKELVVHYCKTLEDCEKHLPQYLEQKVVGFDMEWVQQWGNPSLSARLVFLSGDTLRATTDIAVF